MTVRARLTELGELVQYKAPGTYASLRPGATPDAYTELSSRLPEPLHPDLVALWNWHNGTDQRAGSFELAPLFVFHDLAATTRFWDLRQTIKQQFPHSPWRPAWVPIGSDGCGGFLVIDHIPQSQHRVFLARSDAGESVHLVADSLLDLVNALVAAVRDGIPFDGYLPRFSNGTMEWEPVDDASPGFYDQPYPF
jgi:cell wall assembly regulator SMI1